jgi:ABC-2 type transport system ATP-binding protein
MAEIEEMCDRVIFISHGQIVANDTPDKLTKLIPDHELCVAFIKKPESLERFLTERQLQFWIEDNHARIISHNETIPQILEEMYAAKFPIRNISINEPNLEDVFLKIARESSLSSRPTQ